MKGHLVAFHHPGWKLRRVINHLDRLMNQDKERFRDRGCSLAAVLIFDGKLERVIAGFASWHGVQVQGPAEGFAW